MGRLLTLGETMGVAVTAVGEPLRTTRRLGLSIAGAEATVAIGVCRLGHRATWVGVVGDDELGARIQRELAAEQVDIQHVRVCSTAQTGFMIRDARTAEFTAVTYFRRDSAGAQLAPADVERAFEAGADILHITGITPALSATCDAAVRRAVALARESGMLVSFDVNYRSALAGSATAPLVARGLLAHLDTLFIGEDELWLVTDETDPAMAAQELLRRGPSEVIVKRGAAGALAATASDGVISQEALPVRTADVIGAGDSFTAGYLAARLDGAPLDVRLRWAVTCAGCTVGAHGDWEGLPTRAEIDQRSTGAEATIR